LIRGPAFFGCSAESRGIPARGRDDDCEGAVKHLSYTRQVWHAGCIPIPRSPAEEPSPPDLSPTPMKTPIMLLFYKNMLLLDKGDTPVTPCHPFRRDAGDSRVTACHPNLGLRA